MFDARSERLETTPAWFAHLRYFSASCITALLTLIWHHRWEQANDGTPRRGLFDGLCHLGTALAVALPVLPYVRDRGGFLRLALLSAVVIDLDHVAAARSVRLERTMTMEHRPVSHSLLAPLLAAALAEHWRPRRHLGLAMLLGLGSHLLRDLGTGGAPIVHPHRIVSIPNPVMVMLLGALALLSRTATRLALGAHLLRPLAQEAP